jgi:hypothetical protein
MAYLGCPRTASHGKATELYHLPEAERRYKHQSSLERYLLARQEEEKRNSPVAEDDDDSSVSTYYVVAMSFFFDGNAWALLSFRAELCNHDALFVYRV